MTKVIVVVEKALVLVVFYKSGAPTGTQSHEETLEPLTLSGEIQNTEHKALLSETVESTVAWQRSIWSCPCTPVPLCALFEASKRRFPPDPLKSSD